jgi:hypothetical protein
MTETLVYQDQTIKGLFALYVEAVQGGNNALSDEAWAKMVVIDRKNVHEQLALKRIELNTLLANDNHQNSG